MDFILMATYEAIGENPSRSCIKNVNVTKSIVTIPCENDIIR